MKRIPTKEEAVYSLQTTARALEIRTGAKGLLKQAAGRQGLEGYRGQMRDMCAKGKTNYVIAALYNKKKIFCPMNPDGKWRSKDIAYVIRGDWR